MCMNKNKICSCVRKNRKKGVISTKEVHVPNGTSYTLGILAFPCHFCGMLHTWEGQIIHKKNKIAFYNWENETISYKSIDEIK